MLRLPAETVDTLVKTFRNATGDGVVVLSGATTEFLALANMIEGSRSDPVNAARSELIDKIGPALHKALAESDDDLAPGIATLLDDMDSDGFDEFVENVVDNLMDAGHFGSVEELWTAFSAQLDRSRR